MGCQPIMEEREMADHGGHSLLLVKGQRRGGATPKTSIQSPVSLVYRTLAQSPSSPTSERRRRRAWPHFSLDPFRPTCVLRSSRTLTSSHQNTFISSRVFLVLPTRQVAPKIYIYLRVLKYLF